MIRQALLRDIGDVALLWEALVAYHGTLDDAFPVPLPHGTQQYAERLARQLSVPDVAVFVAVDDVTGHVVGFAHGFVGNLAPDDFVPQRMGIIADVFVDPAHRRAGHGRALVTALQGWFMGRGVAGYEWEVAAANTDGQAFWARVGGRPLIMRMIARLPQHAPDEA